MDNFLNRAIAVAIMFPIGMHAIGYGMEVNGGAHRSNPAWRLFQDYFDFEAGVFKFLLILAGLVLIGWFLVNSVNNWMDERAEKQKAWDEEQKKITDQKRFAHQLNKIAQYDVESEQSQLNESTTPETEMSTIDKPQSPPLKPVTPDELKRRAIEQFKRGN